METQLKYVLVRRRKSEMLEFISNHPESFDQALKLALENEENLSWRATWLVAGVMEKNDQRVRPFIQKISCSTKDYVLG